MIGFLKKHIDQIHFYSFLLMIFMMPIYRHLMPLLMLINSFFILLRFVTFPKETWSRPRFALLFSLIYLLVLPGIWISQNSTEANGDAFLKIPLLIFPVFFSYAPIIHFDVKKVRISIMVFVLGCVLGTLICLGNAVYMYFKTDFWYYVFYYVNLSVLYHPSYYAMFLNFAIILLLFVLICKRKAMNKLEIRFSIALIGYFLIFIFLLNSKAGIISTAISFFVFILYIIIKRKKLKLGLLLLGSVLCLITLIFMVIPSSTSRFTEAFKAVKNLSRTEKSTIDGSSERLFIWKYAFQLTIDSPWLGYGNGDTKNKLMEKYKEVGLENAYNQKLNAHNQFLQTTLASGYPALIVLLLSLLLPLLVLKQNKNSILYLAFIVLICVNFLVESMLETQAGVVFYSLVNSVLFFNIYQKK